MTGAEIDRLIRQALKHQFPAIVGYHHPDSRRATVRGFPDWVFIGRRGPILYREIKGSEDTLSIEQRRVGRAIMHAGGNWAVWGPLDFCSIPVINARAFLELEDII